MTNIEKSTEQPSDEETSDTGAAPAAGAVAEKVADAESLGFLKAVKRDFSEGEISSALTIRFLMERLEDLQKNLVRMEPFQKLYFEATRDLEIEKSRVSLSKAQEIVSAALLTVGGAGMGIAANYFKSDLGPSLGAFVISAVVVVSALYLKVAPK